jgi:hypothetical protein
MTTYPGTPGNGTSSTGGDAPGFGQRVDQIGSSAHQLISDARSAVSDFNSTLDLKGRVERNPYGMVAAALGVGYVLGGGLFTPTTARLIKLGVRLAALPFVKDELLRMAESAVQGYQAGAGAVGGPGAMGTPGGQNRPNV